jgi:hypothetical protein
VLSQPADGRMQMELPTAVSPATSAPLVAELGCRYDSSVKARPRVMRKLGRRQHVVLTMRHGSDHP